MAVIDPLSEHWESSDHALVRRVKAAQSTRDEWWEQPHHYGHADCARMAASHLRRMGYKVRLPPEGSYASQRTARMKLKAMGAETLADALDSMGFKRIAPAATLVGDIIELPGAAGDLSALTIALGNGRVLGWHPDAPKGACVMQPTEWLAAWRVDPKG